MELDKSLPAWSTMETLFFPKLGTEEETRLTIASTCWEFKDRPAPSSTNTDALGSCVFLANADLSGIAK